MLAAVLAGAGLAVWFEAPDPVIAEGIVWSVEWMDGAGGTRGMTRLDIPEAVPGGNGSFKVNVRGVLTRDGLLIEHLDDKSIGPTFIPSERLVSLTFGDGGVMR